MAYYFRLPFIVNLTEEQQMALDEVNSPIALSGGAGTGKTVVSLWKHIQNIDVLGRSSMITTYTKTLHKYILETAKLSSKEAWKYVWTSGVVYTHKGDWKVEEIIIDEAQDLTFNHLKEIKKYAKIISYGADFGQQLYPNRIRDKEEIEKLFPNNEKFDLQQNFRNTYFILNFVKEIFPNRLIPQSTIDELKYETRKGIKPIFFITNNFEKEIKKIIELINEFKSDSHNIAILLPFQNGTNRNGNTWDLLYNQCVDKYYQALTNYGITCSNYYNKMDTNNININSVHITTFKSSKGLEFDTVIIPQFDKIHSNIRDMSIITENDYYVALTRSKRGLYLIGKKEVNFIDKSSCKIENLDKNQYNYNKVPFSEIDDEEIPF